MEVSVPYHKDVISPILSGIKGDCKVTTKRMALSKGRYKMEEGMPSFSYF
jgi:hypothetical protein